MPKIAPGSPSSTQTAAANGDAEAQFALAFSLAAGPAPQDYLRALEWYQKAADQNHRLAQFNLGQMFSQGQGVPKNDSTAVMWIRRAAYGGDAGAQYDLGQRYARACLQEDGMDAAESRIEAYKWFTLAGAQSYRDALNRSDAATMRMTREEVSEGTRRANGFVAE